MYVGFLTVPECLQHARIHACARMSRDLMVFVRSTVWLEAPSCGSSRLPLQVMFGRPVRRFSEQQEPTKLTLWKRIFEEIMAVRAPRLPVRDSNGESCLGEIYLAPADYALDENFLRSVGASCLWCCLGGIPKIWRRSTMPWTRSYSEWASIASCGPTLCPTMRRCGHRQPTGMHGSACAAKVF